MTVSIVEYGVGNVGSVLNMIKRVGGTAKPVGTPGDLRAATKILLPGVGSFDVAMSRLKQQGLDGPLREKATEGVPLLGICLGMQLLASSSEEGRLPGLGLVPGTVRRFRFEDQRADVGLKIPHMGWNGATAVREHAVVKGLETGARFYFVHSYHYMPDDPSDELLRSTYGYSFVSGIQRRNVLGVQFHPEKSHKYGMQLLKNFAEL
ncbi:imidazole glycerol phosphate synthase subunit HisH [Ramlibacter sp. RBP-2]|uniref:Imidazole glycerol phosphate synthase subunit HisH n=1 Tax=Ramlibacter lithotrophicus TaxID=2606681 RepID=A0A7X6DK89_9BURK|nr:imidazole glycerol phosphate synthase subunit HisH [Ramlibacter lithotrophicus]NKE68716.1 imidazole glycerol phosphate synthase subunit HisH [Ramlibacter lithotrophicus]